MSPRPPLSLLLSLVLAPVPAAAAGCAPPRAAHAADAPVVVTFGDSVPAGTACDCEPFPDRYAGLLGAAGRSIDLAVPGATSGDVLRRVQAPDARVTLRSAGTVLLMVGANDVAEGFDPAGDGADPADAAAVARNVAAAVTAVHRVVPDASVVVLGYWNVVLDGAVARARYGPAGMRAAAAATRAVNDALRTAARDTAAAYLETLPAFKGPDGRRDPTALLAADGDHPNDRGHAAIAAQLYAAAPPPG